MSDKRVSYYSSLWTKEQDKAFEMGLGTVSENDLDRWPKITEMVPGKTVEEIKYHYEVLADDITAIESGHVPLPCYNDEFKNDGLCDSDDLGFEEGKLEKFEDDSSSRRKSVRSEHERRRGIAWTEDEHRLFLEGLSKYGRGDWRSISRHFVISRTPTQVASHAQKYFLRLNASSSEKRRASIHDITYKGEEVEPSDLVPPVKTRVSKAASRGKKSGIHALSSEPFDMSTFVPPMIVQSSSFDFDTKSKSPTEAASSQNETMYDDMALSPGSLFEDLPEITKLQ